VESNIEKYDYMAFTCSMHPPHRFFATMYVILKCEKDYSKNVDKMQIEARALILEG